MTYNKLNSMLGDSGILHGINDSKEDVVIQRMADDCILLTTCQSNNWLRKNYYYINGTVEEMYER